jgi:hypothetical protein
MLDQEAHGGHREFKRNSFDSILLSAGMKGSKKLLLRELPETVRQGHILGILAPSATLGISPAGSNARITAQLRLALILAWPGLARRSGRQR